MADHQKWNTTQRGWRVDVSSPFASTAAGMQHILRHNAFRVDCGAFREGLVRLQG